MGSPRKNYSGNFQYVKDQFQNAARQLFAKEHRGRECNNAIFVKVLFLCPLPHPAIVLSLPQFEKLSGRPHGGSGDFENIADVYRVAEKNQRSPRSGLAEKSFA